MSDALIRPATPADIDALLPLVEAYWRFEGVHGFEASSVTNALHRLLADSRLGEGWLATVDSRIAGYLLAVYVFSLEHRGLTAEIDELYLAPDFRGQRLGARLLETAEGRFRERGCTNVCLRIGRDNAAARAFYHRRGYRDVAGFEIVDKML